MRVSVAWLAGLTLWLGGCGGGFTLTVPDAVAPAGEMSVVTPRLLRNDFWVFQTPLNKAVLTLEALPGLKRAAYTDKQGYASAAVPVPAEVGRHAVTVCHQDSQGDEACMAGYVYVLDPTVLALAVDWQTLEDADAPVALARLAEAGVQIVYVSDIMAAKPQAAHDWLATRGLPDGAVASWAWQRDWRWRPTEVVGLLPLARRRVSSMLVGVYRRPDLGDALERLNMAPVHIGPGSAGPADATGFDDWSAFAEALLAVQGLRGVQDYKQITPAAVHDALRQAAVTAAAEPQ